MYTPPGYNQSRESYPVLYLFHGIAGEERGWTTNGRTYLILDNLIAEGTAVPMIIVMPNGQYRGDGVDPNAFEQDLVNAIIPMVEREYRVKTDQANRGIAGLSMGGRQTLDIGFRNLDRFAWIGVFSPAYSESFVDTHSQFLEDANDHIRLLWMAIGEDDGLITRYRTLTALLDERGVKYISEITTGAHEWDVWRIYLRDFAQLIFRPGV